MVDTASFPYQPWRPKIGWERSTAGICSIPSSLSQERRVSIRNAILCTWVVREIYSSQATWITWNVVGTYSLRPRCIEIRNWRGQRWQRGWRTPKIGEIRSLISRWERGAWKRTRCGFRPVLVISISYRRCQNDWRRHISRQVQF